MKKSENRSVFMDGLHRIGDSINSACAEMGLSAAHAKILRHAFQHAVVDIWGGTTVHIPSRHTLELEARDNAIRAARRSGYTVDQLAGHYGLDAKSIYRIINDNKPRRPRRP